MPRDVATFLASGLALGLLALGGWRASTMRERDFRGEQGRWILEDQSSMRQVVALILQQRELPMRDGALDPYFFVRNGDVRGRNIRIFHSLRIGCGPTEEEALRGDYANFPWERYRGVPRRLDEAIVPLLWEHEPIRGRALVAFSDGSAKTFENDEFARLDLPR